MQTDQHHQANAHVKARASELRSWARCIITEYAGHDPATWDMRAIVADMGDRGCVVTDRRTVALAMLDAVIGDQENDLDQSTDDDERADIESTIADLEAYKRAASGAAGRLPWWARKWAADQGISAEGRCRGCDGGTGALCAACQAAVLGPTLVASVAVCGVAKEVA